MPELPEVEVVRSGVQLAVAGANVTGVEVFDRRSLKRHDFAAGGFEEQLDGSLITAAVRRGKFLWFPLDTGKALVVHLGMSGQVLLRNPGTQESGLLRIRLSIEHPNHGEYWLNFVDQRIFGSMAVDRMVDGDEGVPAGFGSPLSGIPSQVAHIARDPMDPAFDDRAFFARLANKRSGIKRVLLDQGIISGIGNIYADEALWAAKIHYDQEAASLSRVKLTRLLAEVRGVLGKALAEGGTSFDAQYVNVNGESGYFSRYLHSYGRTGEPCDRCCTKIKRIPFGGRSSHFCPRCQRKR